MAEVHFDYNIAARTIDIPEFQWNLVEDLNAQQSPKNDEKADQIPDIKAGLVIKSGDLMELGAHRLLCGDSIKKKDVERLMNEDGAELLFTSPPYSDMRDYGGDVDLLIPHLLNFIPGFYPFAEYQVINLGIQRKNNEIIEYWQDYISKAKECGYKFLSWNIWDKRHGGSIASATAMFMITHEWLFVFGKNAKKLNRTIPNKLDGYMERYGSDFLTKSHKKSVREKDGNMTQHTTGSYTHHQLHTVLMQIYETGNIRKNHPAVYPVGLPEAYIEAMTDKGQNIIDPFCGSGSTLIACEKTDRRCFGMEIDEHYCQVIVQRWCDYTQSDVVKINGQTVQWSDYKVCNAC